MGGGAERVCEGAGGPLGARGSLWGPGCVLGRVPPRRARPRGSQLPLPWMGRPGFIHSRPGGLLVLPPSSHRPNPLPETLGHSSSRPCDPSPPFYGRGRLRQQLTEDHPACRREGNLTGLPASLGCPATIFGGPAHWCSMGRGRLQRLGQSPAGTSGDKGRTVWGGAGLDPESKPAVTDCVTYANYLTALTLVSCSLNWQ